MRVWSRFFAPSLPLQNVRQLESLEVERVEIPSDAVYYEWERTKDWSLRRNSREVVMVSRVRVQLLVKV